MSISDSNLVDSNYFMHTALTAIIQYDETKISLSQPNAILFQQKNAKISWIFQPNSDWVRNQVCSSSALCFPNEFKSFNVGIFFNVYKSDGFLQNFAPI